MDQIILLTYTTPIWNNFQCTYRQNRETAPRNFWAVEQIVQRNNLYSGATCTAEQLVQWSNLYSGATCTVEQLVQWSNLYNITRK